MMANRSNCPSTACLIAVAFAGVIFGMIVGALAVAQWMTGSA